MKSIEMLLCSFIAFVVLNISAMGQQMPPPWASLHFSNDSSGVQFYDGLIDVHARSLDIADKRDDFHYVYQPMTGDMQFTARVAAFSRDNPDPWAKGGIMFRNSLTHNSSHFSLLVTPGHGHTVQMRLHDGEKSDGVSKTYDSTFQWLRLARVGKELLGSISEDGKRWKVIYGHRVEMNSNFYIGLAVSSHDTTKRFGVKFDNISIVNGSNDTSPPGVPEDISFRFVTSSIVALNWSPSGDPDFFAYNVLSKGKQLNDNPILKNAFVIEDWSFSENSDIEVQVVDVAGKVSASGHLRINPPARHIFKLPTGNPVAENFVAENHWTDSLAWHNVVNVAAINGLLSGGNIVDSVILHQTIKDLSSKGGGVLFFPGGRYQFTSSICLQSGIVLRGQDPMFVTDANDHNYRPLTKFVFPKYIPSYSGNGTPNNTAFKAIFADTSGIGNFGLVNIDINRASIRFDGSKIYKRSMEGIQFEVPWYRNIHHNVLIYGVRQNNAALPSPLVPTKIQVDEGHAWQRWPWTYGFNISVSASRNCAIINCRLNDDPNSENFAQPNYLTDDLMISNGAAGDFQFKSHFPINVNFVRIFINSSNGKLTFDHPQSYRPLFRNPSIYPELFVPGVEIKNNTVIASRMNFFNLNLITWWIPNTAILQDNVIGTCCEHENYIKDNGYELISNDWWRLAKDEKRLPKKQYQAFGNALPYRILKPTNVDNSRLYPLVVFFHGGGEAGTDNEAQLKNFTSFFFRDDVQKKYSSYVLFPQHTSTAHFGNGDFESAPPWPLVSTMDLIDSLVKHTNVDKRRIYLVGVSSGAAAVWEAIARYPKSFSAGLSFDGIYGRLVDANFASRCATTPIWHFHGVNDISLPLRLVNASFSMLRKNGVMNWKLKVYDGVAHGGWTLAMQEPDLFEWLFSHDDGNFKWRVTAR